jgi:cytochrome c553
MSCSLRSLLFLPLVAGLASAAEPTVFPEVQAKHWAWQPPRRTAPPAVRNTGWLRNPIDAFVLARLEAERLSPAAPASAEQLIRRVYFDLVGQPPTPGESEQFRADFGAKPQAALAGVVEKLLASPHYGERWGRHWLDLVRFAESNGFEFDEMRPDAWRYRDYVIASLNANKPYDRFVREQLASDELYPDDPAARSATAFALLGADMTDAADKARRRQNTLNDMTDTTALAFLGLTVTCCRCHDHKFEPLPQADYFRLQAFFTPAVFRLDLPLATPAEQERHAQALREYQARIRPITDAIAAVEEPYRKKLHEEKFAKLATEAQAAHQTAPEKRTAAQRELVEKTNRLLVVAADAIAKAMTPDDRARVQKLQGELRAFDQFKPTALPVSMGLTDAPGKPSPTRILERGELDTPGDPVEPGFPAILAPGHATTPARIEARGKSTGRRAALAEWITRPDHPLTARVIVNRLWQHHFGKGLSTPSDFGLRGGRPSHPELLDWLAVELVESGWDLKHLHRLMLTSATWQQSTRPSAEAKVKDPDNHLLSHANRLRLEGEIVRDSLLAVSGRLNLQPGGPGVFPPIPAEAVEGSKGWKASADPRDHVRRSVYIFARRNLRFPFLEAFDLPDTNLSCPKRERSTTAPQALALLNASDVLAAATALEARLQRESATEDGRIEQAWRLTLGRAPTERERDAARAFLKDSPLRELCRALFNLNEFIYLD